MCGVFSSHWASRTALSLSRQTPCVAVPSDPIWSWCSWVKAHRYVGIVTPVIHYCMGGLKMNPDAEILTPSDKVIDGLYAVGEAMGGVHGSLQHQVH